MATGEAHRRRASQLLAPEQSQLSAVLAAKGISAAPNNPFNLAFGKFMLWNAHFIIQIQSNPVPFFFLFSITSLRNFTSLGTLLHCHFIYIATIKYNCVAGNENFIGVTVWKRNDLILLLTANQLIFYSI
jgi:hypothetical protein